MRSLTNDDFLVGNEDQLDCIQVGGILDGFVDTEYLWSMGLSKPILHVEVDSRSKLYFIRRVISCYSRRPTCSSINSELRLYENSPFCWLD